MVCRPKYDDHGDQKLQLRMQMVSLDGLLDYQLDDDDFEVCVSCSEALQPFENVFVHG